MSTISTARKLIAEIKEDKTLAQPWKNYALSDAQRLLAVLEKANSTTTRVPPPDMLVGPPNASNGQNFGQCTCVLGKKADVNCPVHGLNV